ncbi:hypothetical protein V2J09_022150 [Rumex salicifolius]
MDSLYLRAGIGPSISVSSNLDARPTPSKLSAGRPAVDNSGGAMRTVLSMFSLKHPFRSLFPGAKQGTGINGVALDDAVSVEVKNGAGNSEQSEGQNGNWVLKALRVKSLWSEHQSIGEIVSDSDPASSTCEESENCDCEYDNEEIVFDRISFSKLLKKVSLNEAKLYAQMSNLGALAYDIPKIKSGNLLKRHGLRFVTSSVEKREQLANAADQEQPSNKPEDHRKTNRLEEAESEKNQGPTISASAAFQTVASAASYLNSRTRRMFVSSESGSGQRTLQDDMENIGDMASFMATTDTVTAVVAAKEEVKQAVADDLNSVSSSPCEWYICDDDQTATRFFVIQGSETLASWQANLLFEPVKFEGFDIMVHRGIYEAAKGMFQQMLPEIRAHTRAHGSRAKLRFTGHSLGGSLSLLINLMLLIREEASGSALLPVITFGAPTVMCGGDELLRKLGLPKSHVQAVTMHRDIVPRAFSCNYPNHVAKILKAVNGSFRNHPCLNNLKLLFAPMGELIILQPDDKYSPQHHLLPSGSGLYLLSAATTADWNLLRSAKLAFLNSPHPLQILADRSAYGNAGTIQRDHDMSSYLRCVRSVIRRHLAQTRQDRREKKRASWRPVVAPRGGIVRIGSESIKSLTRHVHLLVLLLLPLAY